MFRSIYLKTLRDYRTNLLFWVVGLVALSSLYIVFYPTIVESSKDLTNYMEKLPDTMKAFIGEVDYVTPVGYLNSEIFGLSAPLLFIIFAISVGSFAIAGEEERGTLDVLLSYPTTRAKVLLEKFAVSASLLFLLGLVFYASLVIGIKSQNMAINYWYLGQAIFSAALLGLLFSTLALAIGCITGKRGLSVGLATTLAIGTYLTNTLGKVVGSLEPYRKFMPFYYYNEANPLKNGLDLTHTGVLIAAILVLLIISLIAFQRRDLNI